ncbi:MAG: polysaccharide deacetylase family protein [Pirellulales bacterium]
MTRYDSKQLNPPSNSRLLIVHADDLGQAHSINDASIKALDMGLVSSGSIMVPCPWFAEIAAYARLHTHADLGIHLTLTSEWSTYRWKPILSPHVVPTLVDSYGCFHRRWSESTVINADEVEAEIRAQIELALACGIQPTHLDSHELKLYKVHEDLFEVLRRVSQDYQLPIPIARNWLDTWEHLRRSTHSSDFVIERAICIPNETSPDNWTAFYTEVVKKMPSGITQIIVHLAHDNEEMRGIAKGCRSYGATWRQRDFDFFTSELFSQLLEQQAITLVNWRQISQYLLNSKQ